MVFPVFKVVRDGPRRLLPRNSSLETQVLIPNQILLSQKYECPLEISAIVVYRGFRGWFESTIVLTLATMAT